MFVIPEDGPASPARFYAELVKSCPEFEHLRDHGPSVAFLFRVGEWKEQGRTILGTCSMPTVQGRHRPLFAWMLEQVVGFIPDFLFTFNRDWWEQATERQREILTFHEMEHAGQAKDIFGEPRFSRATGEPVWTITPHDVEEFTSVVRRYGAWDDGLVAFMAACNQNTEGDL